VYSATYKRVELHATAQADSEENEVKCIRERSARHSCRHTGLNITTITARSPSPLPKKEHRIVPGLWNHASRRYTYSVIVMPIIMWVLCQASEPVLHQVHWRHVRFLPRLPVGARGQWAVGTHVEFCVLTRIFGPCKPIYICHSGPINSQAILQRVASSRAAR